MPYRIVQSGSGYIVVNSDSGRKHSKRPMPRSRAIRQMRALYAAETKDINPRSKVQELWDSGVNPNDIIGIWYSPQDDSYFVSGGDWAASGTGDKVRMIFGPRVEWVDEGVPNQHSSEAKYSVKLKDAGTVAGAPLHGPGGLLGVPGMGGRKWGRKRKAALREGDIRGFVNRKVAELIADQPGMSEDDAREAVMRLVYAPMMTGTVGGRKWGNRRKHKDCTCGVNVATKEQIAPGVTRIRGNLCNVHGRYGPCDGSKGGKPRSVKPRKPRIARPKKPVKTPEQRTQERAGVQSANRAKVFSELGLAEDAVGALQDLRSGVAVADDGGLVKMGLAEQAADGSYRLTPAGRALVTAAGSGDPGRARDILSGARDRKQARDERLSASEQRKLDAAAKKQAALAEREKKAAEREAAKAQAAKQRAKAAQKAGKQRAAQQAGREAQRAEERAQRLRERAEDRERKLREHEEDRSRRSQERDGDRATRNRPAPETDPNPPAAPKPPTVNTRRPGVNAPARNRGKYAQRRMNVGIRAKAQTASERAMFAKLGKGGGSGGGGGGSKLWPKNPVTGKREPPNGSASASDAPGKAALLNGTALPVRQFTNPEEGDKYLRGQMKRKLTPKEREALEYYQGGEYETMNRHLRGAFPGEMDAQQRRFLDDHAKNINAVMQPLKENVEVHRGLYIGTREYNKPAQEWLAKMQPGATYEEKGFLSTTIDPRIARSFSGSDATYRDRGVQNVDVRIRVPAGTPAVYYNAVLPKGNPGERELLLGSGRKYRVVSRKEKKPGDIEIELEVLP